MSIANASRGPKSWREELLCALFADVLKRDFVGADDDFFSAGGDSLRATMALVAIRERLDASISTRAFFELRTAAKVAAAIAPDAAGFGASDGLELAPEAIGLLVSPVDPGWIGAPAGECVAAASSLALGDAVRGHASAAGVSPGVVFLAAWLDTLREFYDPSAPVVAGVGDAEYSSAEARCVSCPRVLHEDKALSALALHLLSPRASPGEHGRPPAIGFRYCGGAAVESERVPTAVGTSFGLCVTDGRETSLELTAPPAMVRSTQASELLRHYQRRLDQLLGGHEGISSLGSAS